MDQSAYIAKLEQQVADLTKQLRTALARIEELERQTKKNSRNSDKPPSSDGLSKKPAIPRKRGKRKSGGQKGHPGKTLKSVAKPDEQIVHKLDQPRCSCGCDLTALPAQTHWEARQVFDLPPTLLRVTEHRVEQKACPNCYELHRADFPAGVTSRVQYGPRVRALGVLLNVEHSLPSLRIQQLFANLTGYAINESTIYSAVERTFDTLEVEEKIIHRAVEASPVAHADETGARVEGSLHWVHGFSSLLFTFYTVCKQRGGAVINGAQSHLSNFTGWLVHDCLNSYLCMPGEVKHSLCAAHLLRELTAEMERPAPLSWSAKMHALLMEFYQSSNYGKGVVAAEKLPELEKRYAEILALADGEEPPPRPSRRGPPKKTKGRTLFDRFKKHQTAVLPFAYYEAVPFTNNLGERDLRPWKTKLKVAGCFRTLVGARRYARIKGFCSTTRKHGRVVFDELVRVQAGDSFLRAAK